METVFMQSQYPDVTVMETLAAKMELPVEKICTWFQNRRSRFRKESKTGHIQWMRQQLYTAPTRQTGMRSLPSANPSCHVLSTPPSSDSQTTPTTSFHYLPPPTLHHPPQTTCSSRPSAGFVPPGPPPMYQHLPSSLQPQHHEVTYSQTSHNYVTSQHGFMTPPVPVHHTHATSSVSSYGYGEMTHAPASIAAGVFNYNNNSAYNLYSQQFQTYDM
ncbi:hypothetical protein NP493_173g03043 [Ridgeia piscesae]|uniref:Homeobox domain-containing protein n=1 Tax=Ridgeia piscesae TaxID=27915 RepID=A0AAD9P2Y5_RIDPI|nr:hypothetical protein NP493_173g03043 [Ridgeia piscesae]